MHVVPPCDSQLDASYGDGEEAKEMDGDGGDGDVDRQHLGQVRG